MARNIVVILNGSAQVHVNEDAPIGFGGEFPINAIFMHDGVTLETATAPVFAVRRRDVGELRRTTDDLQRRGSPENDAAREAGIDDADGAGEPHTEPLTDADIEVQDATRVIQKRRKHASRSKR